jgi:hypothetical protein
LNSLPKCKAIKIVTANERGIPDIMGCYQGRCFVFECKRITARANPLQLAQLQEFKATDAIVGVVQSVDDVMKLLKPY